MNKRLLAINPNQLPGLFLTQKGQLPQTPAIYFLCNAEGIQYIGQAKNLCDRWAGNKHHIYRKLDEYDRASCWLRWLDCPEIFLDSAERELVSHFQPPMNSRLKSTCAEKAAEKQTKKSPKKSAKKQTKKDDSRPKKKFSPMEDFREYVRSHQVVRHQVFISGSGGNFI